MVHFLNISLRPFSLSDSKSIAQQANNKLVWKNLRDRFPYPYTEKDAILFIEMVSRHNPITEFAIDVNGLAIGAAGIIIKDDVYRLNGEIGYWLGQDYWGKGIGTTVVKELTQIAFKEFNPASSRVLEKNGYIKEATLQKAIIKDGELLNLFIFSKIKE
jgi:ribosomal-protein-alanine N-acetyltransferase